MTVTATRRVVEVDPGRDPRWPEFVSEHPEALVYHHPAWLAVLARAYGYRAHGLACVDARSRFLGILPLVGSRGLITGSRVASLPRTPVAGPLAVDDQTATAIIGTAVGRVSEDPGTRLELRVSGDRFGESVHGTVRVPAESTYVLELPEDPAELRFGNARNHRRIRWGVNKAARLGVEIRDAADKRDLSSWYPLYLDTMRFHARPPIPFRFFEAMWEQLRPLGFMRLLLAEEGNRGGGRLLAGAILLEFGQTVIYAFNGRRRESLNLRPNDLIQWHAIHEACATGHRRYDFGEVATGQEGLVRFKTKWGAREQPAYRYIYPPPGRSDAPGAGGWVREGIEAVWPKLPLWATVRLGELLYRYG